MHKYDSNDSAILQWVALPPEQCRSWWVTKDNNVQLTGFRIAACTPLDTQDRIDRALKILNDFTNRKIQAPIRTCECGSGSNDVSCLHSDWCRCYQH